MGSDDAETEVLVYRREQFATLNKRLDDSDRWQIETGTRLLAIGRSIAGVRRDAVLDAEHVTNIRASVDTLTARVARLERWLDLVDTP